MLPPLLSVVATSTPPTVLQERGIDAIAPPRKSVGYTAHTRPVVVQPPDPSRACAAIVTST